MAHGESYEEFVQKFEVKRTTDDCYTPPAIYEALLAYIDRRVMPLAGVRVLRPFYPGGDYEREDYGPGDVVIDNPPFSILSKILRHYQARGVRYWLFAPHLTCVTEAASRGTVVVCNADIEYHNGAYIATSFVTNMWPGNPAAVVAGDLAAELTAAQATARPDKRKAGIAWPDAMTSPALLGKLCDRGIVMEIPRRESAHVSKCGGRQIFGQGWLLSHRVAKELRRAEEEARRRAEEEARRRAEALSLTREELMIIEQLDRNAVGDK